MRKPLMSAAAAIALIAGAPAAFADMAAAEKWIDEEFQPSALSRDEQVAEMQWFIDAAQPLAGMEINVLSETIPTHTYESTVLTKAFEEITGIKVNHQLLGEGEVVQAVQTQMQTNRNLYDGYVNDSDLIGTHSRLQQTYNLTEQMAGPWADVTSPTLDLEDFIGISFTTGPDGNLYQLPDQQFANLYWFRKDWFDNPEYQAAFKEKYGYDLGVPVNWSAYEDIAEFFTNDVKRDRRRPGLRPHGLRQARPRPRLAHDRRLAQHGRRRHRRRAERHPDRRVGHPHGGGLLQPARLQDQPRRRGERPGGGLCHRQVGRVAARIRPAGRGELRLLPVAAGAQPGQRRPADLLVHRLPRRHGQAAVRGQQHRRRRGQPALARCAVARTAPTGRKARRSATRTSAPGRSCARRRTTAPRPPGSTRSSSPPRPSTPRRATSG